MIFINTASDLLKLQNGSAVSVDYHCSFIDIGPNSFDPNSTTNNLNTATTVTLVTAPASGINRQVKVLSATNVGGAGSTVVTFQKQTGAGTFNVSPSVTLLAGEALMYEDAAGWYVLDAMGSRKTVGSTGATGGQGPQGVATFLEADGLDGADGPPGPSGPAGAAGTTGSQGPQGVATFLEADPGEEGQPGAPGNPGATGLTGAQGPQGVATFLEADQGQDGDQGPPGPQGIQGTTGTTGAQGPQGVATFLEADVGLDGDIGPPGTQGAQGVQGTSGPQGLPGVSVFVDDGLVGEDGLMGATGPPGLTGSTGGRGTDGAQGLPGVSVFVDDGLQGDDGAPGPAGVAGAAGSTGGQGPQGVATFLDADPGEQGDFGLPGSTGPQGPIGTTGPQGPQGVATFLDGDAGLDGDPGPPGAAGVAGSQGTTGAQGPQGVATFLENDAGGDGDPGPPGPTGPQGPQGIPGTSGSGTGGGSSMIPDDAIVFDEPVMQPPYDTKRPIEAPANTVGGVTTGIFTYASIYWGGDPTNGLVLGDASDPSGISFTGQGGYRHTRFSSGTMTLGSRYISGGRIEAGATSGTSSYLSLGIFDGGNGFNPRWTIQRDSEAESGSDAGSNLVFTRATDVATTYNFLIINRATGAWALNAPAGAFNYTGDPGAPGAVFTSQGPSGPPIWQTPPGSMAGAFLTADGGGGGEDGSPGPPGPAGPAGSGATGAQGPTGPAVYLEAEPGDDGMIGPPGATGPQGPAGGGSFSATEIEVDFGTKPVFDALFTISDGAVSATSKIVISESGKPATGRVAGDAQFDSISAAANPGTGSFALYCMARPGPVVGKRKLQYSVA